MPNLIETPDKPNLSRPEPMHPRMRSGLDRLLLATRPEGDAVYLISESMVPNPDQRLALSRRRDDLVTAAAARESKRLKVAVTAFAATMPSPNTDQDEPDAIVSLYCLALSDLPIWAAEEACAAALRGKVGSTGGRFRPTPGEVHLYAERLCAQFLRERQEINRVLNARIEKPRLSAEERAAAVARVRDIVKGVASGAVEQPRRPAPDKREQDSIRREAERTMEDSAEAWRAPIAVDPSLVSRFVEQPR